MKRDDLPVEGSVRRHVRRKQNWFLAFSWPRSTKHLDFRVMRTHRLLAVYLGLSAGIFAQGAGTYLEGCLDPTKIANGLRTFQEVGWPNLTVERVRDIWPTGLRRISCEPNCVSLASYGRVIKGEVQCSESFGFEAIQGADRSLNTQLSSLGIKYTAFRHRDLASVVKTLMRGLRMGDDVEALTFGSTQHLTWKIGAAEPSSCGIRIQYWRRKGLWHLLFDLSCGPDRRAPAAK
jgi:hypothetical protein